MCKWTFIYITGHGLGYRSGYSNYGVSRSGSESKSKFVQWEQYNAAIGFGVPVRVGIHVRMMYEVHKALATRWPPSGHLLSGHLPPAFKGTYPKHVPQYHDYQLLGTCYSGTCHHLSKDYFNRGTHASINYDKCICHVFTLRQIRQ